MASNSIANGGLTYETYNLGMPYPSHHPVMESETSAIPAGNVSSSTERTVMVKLCGVCGDVAKSYHFGGLSCDSCKAFFRRSIQNDNYVHFQCCQLNGQCVLTLTNRKRCQYCRIKRCFQIGMEKSWVMTEEERQIMMKARAEKKLSKQLAASGTSGTTPTTDKSVYSVTDFGASSDYEPHIQNMTDFLSPVEMKEIESIVTKYMHAYQHVPYRNELRYYDNERPGVQIMEMFGTLVRRFAFYARLMPDFTSLPFDDQSNLLRGGVLEMCVLRGALVFDPVNNHWPNVNMSMYKDSPVLKLENMAIMASNRLFQMHIEFISCIQQMSVDEPTIMLLILIVLFTPERANLVHIKWVEKFQAYYTYLLERYMNWRFGPAQSTFIFGKLLTKLSDLRELSDSHNGQNLVLGGDEISSIQYQLQHLKINPYPECKVVPDDSSIPEETPIAHTNTINYPVSSCGNQSVYEIPSETQSRRSWAIHQSVPNGADYVTGVKPMVPHQQPLNPQSMHALHRNNSAEIIEANAHNVLPEPPSSSSSYSVDCNSCGKSSGSNGQIGHCKSGPYREQQEPQITNSMAMRFMQAIQQSVHQVISEPYFGFEWVKPDNKFDTIVDDDVFESFKSASSEQTLIPSTVEEFSAPELSQSTKDAPLAETPSATVSQQTLEELYEAIEEYSELYG